MKAKTTNSFILKRKRTAFLNISNRIVLHAVILCIGFVVILVNTNTIYGQISITTEAIKPNSEPDKYDSTRNFVGQDIEILIGQRLYLPPNYDTRTNNYRNYENFRLSPERRVNFRRPGRSIYQYDEGQGVVNPEGSNHDALANTYFSVKDVIRDGDDTFIHLVHEENNNDVFFIYPTRRSIQSIEEMEQDFPSLNSWPFIVVGLMEKLRNEFVDERIIVKDMHLRKLDRTVLQHISRLNIETGEELTTYTGMPWTVLDLTIDASDNYSLAFIAENEFGEKTTLSLNYGGRLCVGMFMGVYYEDQAKEMIDLIGKDNFESILKGNVQTGFTKLMVRLAMEPGYSVRNTSSSVISGQEYTVWEYGGGRFLYFNEYDILADIMNW